MALALRLAAHEVVTEAAGSPPVLLLDDVFSELDEGRSAALLASLPAGQTLLTSAAGLPRDAHPDAVLVVEGGRIGPALTAVRRLAGMAHSGHALAAAPVVR